MLNRQTACSAFFYGENLFMTFQELNLNQQLQDAVQKAGYREPSPIQEKAIPEMLDGHDLIACAQTGTGKTAAFALPILNELKVLRKHKIRALVLTPTRELAIQIFENFKKYGRYLKLRTVCIYGGAKQGPQLAALDRGCDILVATPGRLMDYMDRGIVSLDAIEMFVLDEGDRMLDMGFVNDIRKIVSKMNTERQTVLFSATMPKPIEQLAREILRDPVEVKVAPTTSPAETVDQKICFTEKENKKLVLGSFLTQPQVKKSIVFTRTKHGADRLVRELKKEGINSLSIHGDKAQGQRQNALERFRSGNIKVLVATDVAARGIDIPKITHVFNYDLPEESESYIHRIGRAGRAGKSGEAVSLCCSEELGLLYDIEHMMKKEIPEVETEWTVALERKKKPSANKRMQKKNGGYHGNRRFGSAHRRSHSTASTRTRADRPHQKRRVSARQG